MAFQPPAAGYAEQRICFSDLVHLSPYSTYVLRSAGDYPGAGIVEGSLLAVDRGLTPAHGQIVIAEVDVAGVVKLFNRCGWQAEPEGDASLPHQYSMKSLQGY